MWIGGGYLLLTAIVASLFAAVVLSSDMLGAGYAGELVLALMVLVLILLCVVAGGVFGTEYVIGNGVLTCWSPFAVIRIRTADIAKAERTRIPFYFKGFGASLYSGNFYAPGTGWMKTVMTNMTDGVLITDKRGKHYLITPSNPDAFVKSCRAKE
jgi:hypothetical protein